jgi:phage recombination protein Bet
MSNTSMVTADHFQLTADHLLILEQAGVIPRDTPPAQVAVFQEVCRSQNLNPFLKQIHLVGYGGKYSVITGIDGFRARAEATGLHAGTEEAKFNLTSTGEWKSPAELRGSKNPISATVTVYKIIGGVRVPFTHTALFTEFSSGKQKWATMPFQMLAKVAESHALRKAFPGALSGLNVHEEVAAIQDTVTPDVREETEAEQRDNEHRESINATIKAMTDPTLRRKVSDALKSSWSNRDWSDPIRAKIDAGELTEAYLVRYCTEAADTTETTAKDA